MLTFLNQPSIKDELLRRLERRRRAGQIVQNGEVNFDTETESGDALGVTLEGWRHEDYETRFGIPRLYARVENELFDFLSPELAPHWPGRFMSAIPVGIELTCDAWNKLVLWRYREGTDPLVDSGYSLVQKRALFIAGQILDAGSTDESLLTSAGEMCHAVVGEHNEADAADPSSWREIWQKELGRQATYATMFAVQAAGGAPEYKVEAIGKPNSQAISASMFLKCSCFAAGYAARVRHLDAASALSDLAALNLVGEKAEALCAQATAEKLCEFLAAAR